MRFLVTIIGLTLLTAFNAIAKVTLLFPDDGEELTDIAVSFKAKITDDGPYFLYVCKNEDFSGNVIRRPAQTGKGEIKYNIQYFLTYQGKITPNDRFVLSPGVWYWRVSGDGGKTFSETRALTVNNYKPLTPPEREAGKPLFHMRLRSELVDYAPNGDIEGQLKKMIPEHLKEYIVLDIGQSFSFLPKERSLYEYCKIFDDLGYNYFFDLGSHAWLGRIASLGEMEKVFRDLHHCVGGSLAEIFYYIYNEEAERSMLDGALELCRKYGKKLVHSDMNWRWAKWQYFNYLYYDIFKERNYADYYLPLFKTTSPWGTYTNISALQGMKLSGMVKDIGIWADWWTWEKFGQVDEIELEAWLNKESKGNNEWYPFIQNIKFYIYGMTFGSTVFALESNLQWHWRTAEPNDHYYRYLKPFISAVVQENLIPSTKAINRNFNVIVDTRFSSDKMSDSPTLTYVKGNIWGDFLRSTYGISDIPPYNNSAMVGGEPGIQASYLEMIPNTDRYPSGIPFLPKPGISAPMANAKPLEVISIYDLDTQQKVNEKLNKHYHASSNEAFAQRIDSSIFVFNTLENHDIKQSYKMGIHYAGIDSLMGDIDLMSYVVGRCRPDGKTVFFQTNAYVRNSATWNSNGGKYALPAYPSILHFKCQLKPTLRSNKMYAITQNWDAENGILTLEIDHTKAGAVNFTLEGIADMNYTATRVQVAQKDIEVWINGKVQLAGTLYPQTIKGTSLSWRSLNPNIARVTVHGMLTGLQEGQVNVVAEANGITDTLMVNVVSVPVERVKISSSHLDLIVADSAVLQATIDPKNASDQSIKWYAQNTDVVQVSPMGKVIALAKGETYVLAFNEVSGLKDSCLVTVKDRLLTKLDLGADTIRVKIGEYFTFNPSFVPENASDKNIYWQIKNVEVLRGFGNRRFVAFGFGTTYILAVNRASGIKDSCYVEVDWPSELHELKTSNEISIYPNPIKKGCPITVRTKGNSSIYLYNSLGQSMFSSLDREGAISIATSSFQPGIYVLLVKTLWGVTKEKIIIKAI